MAKTVPFVPEPLESYECSSDLIFTVLDALTAHEAYYKAGVLHGNVAPQNIMNVPDIVDGVSYPKGILIDLDVAHRWRDASS